MNVGKKEIVSYYNAANIDSYDLTIDLFNAIDKDQFYLLYQPKLHLATNKISGLETFIRWRHPTRGVIYPNEFLKMAKNNNMIHETNLWIIEQSIKQIKLFEKIDLVIPISINISEQEIRPKMVRFLKRSLSKHSVNPKLIILELTENDLMTLNSRQRKMLNQISDMGIKLTIDNYGVGLSSLEYISQLDLEEIKIDKSFTKNIDENPSNLAIVTSTLEMIHGLQISSVAEGVENECVKDILFDLECDYIQGNVIVKPMKACVLINWMYEFGYLNRVMNDL